MNELKPVTPNRPTAHGERVAEAARSMPGQWFLYRTTKNYNSITSASSAINRKNGSGCPKVFMDPRFEACWDAEGEREDTVYRLMVRFMRPSDSR